MILKNRFLITRFRVVLLLCLMFRMTCFLAAETLSIGIYHNPPKVFIDDTGKPSGFFVDITNKIARRQDLKLKYVYGTWAENLEKLDRGELDLVLDVSYSRERAQKYQFNNIYVIESWIQAFAERSIDVQSIADFHGKRIVVLKGSIQERFVYEEVSADHAVNISVLLARDYHEMINMIQQKRADIILADRFFIFQMQDLNTLCQNN